MLKKVKKAMIISLSLFLLVFGFRLIYQFNSAETVPEVQFTGNTVNSVMFDNKSVANFKNNYASSRMVMASEQGQKTTTVDQKYERIGYVNSQTGNFEEDKKKVMNVVKENKAIIQFENNSGTNSSMFLEITIGVHPDKFDSFVEKMKQIGTLNDFRVEKIDKTSEYKDLNARKLTLEKAKESFSKLKTSGGNINDLINLENKIIEIDEKIQDLGVKIGDFNEENELCTVKFTLTENKGLFKETKMTFNTIMKIIFLAFAWSIKSFLLLLLLIAMCGLSSYLILLAVDKGRKVYKNIYNSKNHDDA